MPIHRIATFRNFVFACFGPKRSFCTKDISFQRNRSTLIVIFHFLPPAFYIVIIRWCVTSCGRYLMVHANRNDNCKRKMLNVIWENRQIHNTVTIHKHQIVSVHPPLNCLFKRLLRWTANKPSTVIGGFTTQRLVISKAFSVRKSS